MPTVSTEGVSAIFDPTAWDPVPGFEDLVDITYHRAKAHGTVRIAFDRPEVRNAFRPATVDELIEAYVFLRTVEHRLQRVWTALLWRARIEESVAALWKLFNRNVPIGVVSNASGQIEGILATQGVCQVGAGAGVPVSVVSDSHFVGYAKPDPRVFEPALGVLAAQGVTDRSRIGYVGDSFINDVAGAAAAGLVPLHLDPYGLYADLGHERIESLHELLDMVARG